MSWDVFLMIGIALAWIVLHRWVLPRMGVNT